MQLLVSLPSHRQLVDSLFDYDVIGLQTEEWLDSFHRYVTHEMGAVIGDDGLITVGDRSIRAIECPIGIDAENFAETVKGEVARAAGYRMVTRPNARHPTIGGKKKTE